MAGGAASLRAAAAAGSGLLLGAALRLAGAKQLKNSCVRCCDGTRRVPTLAYGCWVQLCVARAALRLDCRDASALKHARVLRPVFVPFVCARLVRQVREQKAPFRKPSHGQQTQTSRWMRRACSGLIVLAEHRGDDNLSSDNLCFALGA